MALKYLDDHGLATLWERIKSLITRRLNSYYTKTEVDNKIDSYQVPNGAITTSKLADAATTTAKIANGAVTNAKIDDTIRLGEYFFNETVTSDQTADYFVDVPIDFSTYEKIVIDVKFTPTPSLSGTHWAELSPRLGNNSATVYRTGHQFVGANYERQCSMNIDHPLAIGAAASTPSEGHLELTASGSWPTFYGRSVGGPSAELRTQEMMGKIHHAGSEITSVRIRLRNPHQGATVTAYGYKK